MCSVDEYENFAFRRRIPICIADRPLAPYFRLARIKAKKYGNVPRLFRLVSLHNGALGGVLYAFIPLYTFTLYVNVFEEHSLLFLT